MRSNTDDESEQGHAESDDWPADEADVICPHCGETIVITLDPAGGSHQEYVEDCEVCCRPWQVRVHYAGGSVDVSVEAG